MKCKAKIKIGTSISQDHHFLKWPACLPPLKEYQGEEYLYMAKNPDMIFDAEWKGDFWVLKADGYGHLKSLGDYGDYGNGKIYVSEFSGVDQVVESLCPFCSCANVMPDLEHGISGEVYHFISCRSCGARGGHANTPDGAVRNWNMRGCGVDNSPHFPC